MVEVLNAFVAEIRERILIHIIRFTFFTVFSNAYSQDGLFFLRATPVEDPYLNSNEMPAALLKYNKDSMKIKIVVNLASYENRVKDIRYYYDDNRIILLKETKKFEKSLGIINTDRFDSLIHKSITCPEFYKYVGFKVIEEKNNPFLCIECFNKDLEKFEFLKGLNLIDLTEKEFFPANFKHIVLSGTSFYIDWSDYQNVYSEPTNGNLRMPVVRDINERPIFPLALPDSLRLGKKEMLNVLINNKNQFVINLNTIQNPNDQLNSTNLITYNYGNQKWNRVKIKGTCPYVNGYGNWLAGVVYSYSGKNNDTFKESPGKEIRDRLNSKNEFKADLRFSYFHIYSPGILYLFNTLTLNYIEWSTGQGDSEILLIENDLFIIGLTMRYIEHLF